MGSPASSPASSNVIELILTDHRCFEDLLFDSGCGEIDNVRRLVKETGGRIA